MRGGFWRQWGGSILKCLALVFTIPGGIIALAASGEGQWIWPFIIIALYLSSIYLLLRKSQDEKQLRAKLEERNQLLEQTREKLNEVPYSILMELQRVIELNALSQTARSLAAYAEAIERMKMLTQASPKPINLRTFRRQGGSLYAVAKVKLEALNHIRPGDQFLLTKKSESGLETPCATLVVHQPPNLVNEVAFFQIQDFLSDEMGHIENLAQGGNVEGIKGYLIKPAIDLSGFRDVDFQTFPETLALLVKHFIGNQGV
jgi:hypothetical protein